MKRYDGKLLDAAIKWVEKGKGYVGRDDLRNEVKAASTWMRKRNYSGYLQSREWKEKRAMVLARDGHQCILCNAPASHVHHLTYERIYNESLYDLISLCPKCHEMIHLLDEKSY